MNKDDIRLLMSEIDEELVQEKTAAMGSAERALNEVARKLLQLQRDLTVPGAAGSDGTRRERILRWIEEENF